MQQYEKRDHLDERSHSENQSDIYVKFGYDVALILPVSFFSFHLYQFLLSKAYNH